MEPEVNALALQVGGDREDDGLVRSILGSIQRADIVEVFDPLQILTYMSLEFDRAMLRPKSETK
jgi:hypothetical protein